jgi:hypothetical protein
MGAAQAGQLGGQCFAGLLEPGADGALGDFKLDGDGGRMLALAVASPGAVA